MRQGPSGKGPRIYSDDLKMKVCRCSIHNGQLVPLEKFWTFKHGKRKGLPSSRCIDGERIYRGRNPLQSGFVPYYRVRFIFLELEFRIGRYETGRRIGVSQNFWWRHESRIPKSRFVRKATVVRAISVLRYLRENDEVRHRDSIKHGASARGRKERVPVERKDFNGKWDSENERKRVARRQLTV
jgi:hypothetical protein